MTLKKIMTGIAVGVIFLVVMTVFYPHIACASGADIIQANLDYMLQVYPSGSYFSKDGKACGHVQEISCSNCQLRNIPSRGGLPSGNNVGTTDGATCVGFAKYAFYCLSGAIWPDPNNTVYTNVPYSQVYQKAKLGDYISYSGHAGIYLSGDSSGYWMYEANYTTTNQVMYRGYKHKEGPCKIVHAYCYEYPVPLNNDTEPPTISNVRVTNLTKAGYTVTCNVSDNVGVTRVAFPTWTDTDWQDDIVWQDGTVTNGTATFRVNISDHGNQHGKYLTYIYAYDAAGNVSAETDSVHLYVYVEDIAPVVSNARVIDITDDGYTVTCDVSDNIGVTRVAFPTWTDTDWQDDIVWQDGTVTNGTATFRVNISDHGNQRGKYLTYIYAYDACGNVSEETDAVRLYVHLAPVIHNTLPVNLGEEFYAYIRHQSANVYLTNQQNNIGGETFTGENTQLWRFTRQSNGAYSISSNYDNACMEVAGASTEDGANVYANSGGYLGNANQEFFIYRVYDAYYLIPVHTNGAFALDMSSITYNLEMWGVGADWAPQEFDIITIPKMNGTLPADLGEEFYAYIRNQSQDMYLTNQQDNIGGEVFTGESTQIWRFNKQSNGAYSISSAYDNACMDVLGNSMEDGLNVYAYSDGYLNNGNGSQEFYIYRAYDAYYFSPAYTNGAFALDMSSITHNLEMWGVGADWAPQEFDLEEVLYKLEYDPNGGIDAPENQTKYYREDITLSTDVPQWESRIFLGWATLPDAAEAEYQPGDIYSEDKDVTLYAQWTPIKVTGISIPGTQTLSIGESKTLTAVITPDDALNKDVAWKSSDTSVVTVTNGTIKGVKEGTATVTATASDGSSVSASCTVTVRSTITGLTLNRSSLQLADEGAGSSYLLKVEKTPGNGRGTVNWSSSSTAVAQVTQNGVVTAQGSGMATITASVVNGPSVSCTVSIVGNMPIMTLPAGLKTIEEEAFLNTAAARIVIPSGVESIGAGAFSRSSALKYVVVPDSVVSIGDGVFADDPDLCLICSENSAAEEYAVANGIEYTTEGASVN